MAGLERQRETEEKRERERANGDERGEGREMGRREGSQTNHKKGRLRDTAE